MEEQDNKDILNRCTELREVEEKRGIRKNEWDYKQEQWKHVKHVMRNISAFAMCHKSK
jgi:hypothetical protein